MKVFSRLLFLVLVCAACSSSSAQETAQDEHAAMNKEHQQSIKDHMQWTDQLYEMRIEHRKALAALSKLRAEILEHEAHIESIMRRIEKHGFEIQMHDQAMHDHEETGESESHDQLEKEHAQIENHHADLKKMMADSAEHHRELITGILSFTRQHLQKFHQAAEEGHAEGDRK